LSNSYVLSFLNRIIYKWNYYYFDYEGIIIVSINYNWQSVLILGFIWAEKV